MVFLPFVYYTSFFLCLVLITYLYAVIGVRSKLPRLSLWIMACFVVWNFGDALLHNPWTGRELARVALNITGLGAFFVPSLFLLFVLEFSHRRYLSRSWAFHVVLFLVPLLMNWHQWTEGIIRDLHRVPYGWAPEWPGHGIIEIWEYFSATAFILSLVVLYVHSRQAVREVERRQARILMLAFMAIVPFAMFNCVTLRHGMHFPDVLSFGGLFWGAGLMYVIREHAFLRITPARAAENIISTMRDGLVLLDTSGRVSDVNRAFLDLSGYTKAVVLGNPADRFFRAEDRGEESGLLPPGDVRDRETVLLAASGNRVPVRYSSSILRDAAGEPAGAVLILRDMTDKKALEEQLLQQVKLAGAGQMAAGVVHDLNNPLTGALASIELVERLDGNSLSELERGRLASAKRAAERMRKIIADLLAFSRPRGGMKEYRNVNDIIRKAVALGGLGLEGITLKLNLGNVPDTPVNPEMLAEALLHILSNSIDALRAVPDKVITISTAYDWVNDMIRVSVRDNGCGMDAEIRSAVFEPFFTTKEQGHPGLGLSIVYGIVKDHGGSVELHGERGSYTELRLSLPAQSETRET